MKENSNVLLFETKTPAWVLTLEIFQSAAVFSGHQGGLSWSKYERGARTFKWWHAEDLRYGSCKTKVKHWLKEKGLEEKETGSFRGRFHDMIMKHYQAAWWLQISLNKLGPRPHSVTSWSRARCFGRLVARCCWQICSTLGGSLWPCFVQLWQSSFHLFHSLKVCPLLQSAALHLSSYPQESLLVSLSSPRLSVRTFAYLCPPPASAVVPLRVWMDTRNIEHVLLHLFKHCDSNLPRM